MFKSKKKLITFILILVFIIPLYGCWDNRDIEKLSFVMGIGLDKNDDSDEDLIYLTTQIALPQGSAQESGSSSVKYQNVSVTDRSVHGGFRKLPLQLSNPTFNQHLKVIILQEQLARSENIQSLLSQIIRDNESRMSQELCVTRGTAFSILNTKTEGETPSERIIGIVDNQYRSTGILPPARLGEINSKLIQKNSFLLQNINIKNGKLIFDGAAVVKGSKKKIIGFLEKPEVEGLMWLKGEAKGGIVNINSPEGQHMVYEISSVHQKIHSHVRNGHISFHVDIQSDGRLSEDWDPDEDDTRKKKLEEVASLTEKHVFASIKKVLNKTQKEYAVDVVGFGEELRIHYPQTWRKVEERWEEVFKDIPITYDVDVKVKGSGSIKSK